jgi:23S rRNA (adenine2503-C2)-methyltransferase
MPSPKTNLIGLSKQQTEALLTRLGVPKKQVPLRRKTLWNWIYVRGENDFSRMNGIGKPLQDQLVQHGTLQLPKIVTEQVSIDGTRKWLLEVIGNDGRKHQIETVYIPENDRGTVCVSSQVGCSLNCTFCHTGTMKMMKNLSAYEILGQIMLVRDRLNDYPDRPPVGFRIPSQGRSVSNVVMMGMGEPLLNFDNVKQALLIAMDDDGLGLSRRRITLSTSGVVPGIERTGNELNIALAISLHAVNDALRDQLVPINRKYPLAALLKACENYRGLSNARRITFEYVMLDGVNDSIADAQSLVQLLRPIPSKINLIPFNPWPGSAYLCSSPSAVQQFANHLRDSGYPSPVRATRGQDIMAACGQLKSNKPAISMLPADLN